jgi:hypothetical protein
MKLTPAEIIRLGIEQGHSADVIAASLEAAGKTEQMTAAMRQILDLSSSHDVEDAKVIARKALQVLHEP